MKYYKIYDNIGNDYIGKYTKSEFKEYLKNYNKEMDLEETIKDYTLKEC